MDANAAVADTEAKYRDAYGALAGIVEKRKREGKYAALGYTSNLDLLCDFKAETLNALLADCKGGLALAEMKPAGKIRTAEGLAASLAYYCIRGAGGEVDLESPELVKSLFPFQYGVGGTAVQAAMALAAVGCPSVVHMTDDSSELCGILSPDFIYAVSREGKLTPANKLEPSREQEIHCTIQFKKGDVIRMGDEAAVIPRSNRVMLTKVTVNELLPLSLPYFKWIEDNANDVSSNVLSSFNCIIDAALLEERLGFVKEHVRRYRENNPKGIVIFEDAHFHSPDVCRICMESICGAADILSLNEEELQYTLEGMYGFALDIGDVFSCIEGAKFIRGKLGMRKGVIVHTKDYAMYVGDDLDVDIERALMYGNMMATAKAMTGCYGTMKELGEALALPLSPDGQESLKALQGSPHAGEAVLVPSKYIDKPKFTVGLGDSFIGGLQTCFGME